MQAQSSDIHALQRYDGRLGSIDCWARDNWQICQQRWSVWKDDILYQTNL